MREIQVSAIQDAVAEKIKNLHFHLTPDVKAALRKARAEEQGELAQEVLDLLLENSELAAKGVFPLCQDTGLTIFFVELGQEVAVVGGSLEAALQAGLQQATQEACLRRSVAAHPFLRTNTGTNAPGIVHYQVVPGAGFKIRIMAKGGGCENASSLAMLLPGSSEAAVEEHIVKSIQAHGAAACPPLILGIGIGGSFDTAPELAKKALLRPLSELSADPVAAAMEQRLLQQINALGLGPQGWGGTQTALAVMIEIAPCHITSLPVAINVECHSHRVAEVRL